MHLFYRERLRTRSPRGAAGRGHTASMVAEPILSEPVKLSETTPGLRAGRRPSPSSSSAPRSTEPARRSPQDVGGDLRVRRTPQCRRRVAGADKRPRAGLDRRRCRPDAAVDDAISGAPCPRSWALHAAAFRFLMACSTSASASGFPTRSDTAAPTSRTTPMVWTTAPRPPRLAANPGRASSGVPPATSRPDGPSRVAGT